MGVGNIATSGLQAALTNIESISNNIANVNTLGYKKSFVNFSSMYAASVGGNNQQPGIGVRVNSIGQDFTMGRVESSTSGLDLRLATNGFFVQTNHSTGVTSYTRAGRFEIDDNGYVQGSGGTIQGFPAINGKIVDLGGLVDLKVGTTPIPALPSQNVNFVLNLDSGSPIITNTFNPTDPTSYNFLSNETLYDSLGNAHQLSTYYIKTAQNNWTAQVTVDGTSAGSGSIGFGTDGSLTSVTGLTGLSWAPTNGATTPQTLNINLTGTTQYAGDNNLLIHNQDGFKSGSPMGCSIDADGRLNVYYSNGMSIIEGQIAVAEFNSPNGLAQADNASWIQTLQSGSPIVNINTSTNAIVSNSIEYSNVDLTEELVLLISAQHDFQANAQVQSTYNDMLKTIENL